LSAECAPWVAPPTKAAIVKTESQFYPLAININAGARLERQPASKAEAVVTAKWLIANNYNIDLGLGQVNSANLAKTNLSVEDAFDACKNIAAAATILQWNYASASKKISGEQAALHAAISAYNTGSFTKGFSNGYVQKVLNNAPADVVASSKRSAAITPIAVVNKENAAAVKQKIATQDSNDVVKVEVSKEVENTALNVYGGVESAERNVMVYR
jgi:type IV secretion system protein VirB1